MPRPFHRAITKNDPPATLPRLGPLINIPALSQPFPSRNRWRIAAFAAVTAIWFFQLGYRDLIEPDEGRYAEIPREMAASGDWITPRLNGFKYFEKPPLQYWATALNFRLFGESNTMARLWPAATSFAGLAWVWFLGRKLFGGDTGFYAMLVLSSYFLYVTVGHLNSLDAGVAFLLSLGVGALLLAQTHRGEPSAVRRWMLLGWAALAAATLSKGLIGLVLPGGAVLLYSLWQRDASLWRHLQLGRGLLLYLALTAPWFVLVSLENPDFPGFFFVREHLQRFTSEDHPLTHRAPWWFFAPVLLAASLPWLLTTLSALLKPGFSWAPRGKAFEPERFLWVYAVFILCFFSLSHSKLPLYIVPMLPALSLLAARRLAKSQGILKGDLAITAIVAVLLLLGAWRAGDFATPDKPAEILLAYRPWLAAAALTLAAAVFACRFIHTRIIGLATVALGALLAFQLLGWGFQSHGILRSSRLLAEALKPYHEQGIPVYSVAHFDPSLPFYLKSPIRLVAFRGELEHGIRQQPEAWIGNMADFYKIWQGSPQAVAVLTPSAYDARMKYEHRMPMRLIYRDAGQVAVARR